MVGEAVDDAATAVDAGIDDVVLHDDGEGLFAIGRHGVERCVVGQLHLLRLGLEGKQVAIVARTRAISG